MMDRDAPIAVVGAGVAGLTLAVGLQRRGTPVCVFERAPELRAEGGALLLWSNAVASLDAIGLGAAVRAAGKTLERTEFRRHDGEVLWELPMSELSREAGAPSLLIGRTELIEVLASGVAVGTVRYGAHVVGFDETPTGVDLYLRGAGHATFRGVVGADGVHSSVRQQLVGLETPRSAEQIAWVGLARGPDWPRLGTAVATVGDGIRFWAGRIGDGRVYWYATVPESATGKPRRKSDVAALFASFHDPVQKLIGDTPLSDCVRTAIFDRRPLSAWGVGPVTLVGDAAHPCTPDLGQGACQGIESACDLAGRLPMIGSPVEAMRAYEQTRQARTAKVTAMSRATAKLGAAEGATAGAIRDLGVRFLLPAVAMPRLRWLLSRGDDTNFEREMGGRPLQPGNVEAGLEDDSMDGLW